MRRVLFLIALSIFVATSAAIARVESRLGDSNSLVRTRAKPDAKAYRGFSVAASTYRSPARLRKIVIQAGDRALLDRAKASGAIELAEYGSFKLIVMD